MCEFVKQNWPALGFAILPNLGTKIGFIVMRNANLKYCEKLKTPSWTPPYWVFPTVWTTMYAGIGYASYLVYKEGDGLQGAAKLPLGIYGAHVLANWAWNPIFFGLKNIKLSLVDMAIIDITALGMVCTFSRVNRVAGVLIIPYCLWLGFATVFNYYMYRDNKEEPKEE